MTKKYIDPDKIDFRLPYFTDTYGDALVSLSAVRAAIAQTPSEDVVEVVRCRDCEYCDHIYPEKRLGEEAAIDYFCKIYGALVDGVGFCSVGARKEQA